MLSIGDSVKNQLLSILLGVLKFVCEDWEVQSQIQYRIKVLLG